MWPSKSEGSRDEAQIWELEWKQRANVGTPWALETASRGALWEPQGARHRAKGFRTPTLLRELRPREVT